MDELIPNHVAIILDGNRRWAKNKGLLPSLGHKAGFDNIKKIAVYALNRGVKVLSVFAFSTENFKREQKEVDFLMNLFIDGFGKERDFFMKENIKVIFSGSRISPLPKTVIEVVNELERMTKDNTKGIFNVCLNYGGHQEIIDATKKIVAEVESNKLNINELNEDVYNSYLYQNLPPIDLMIRTSGEIRISNFMLWQLAYAEMYFPDVHFPDFDENEFDKAIMEYNNRNRRFGGK